MPAGIVWVKAWVSQTGAGGGKEVSVGAVKEAALEFRVTQKQEFPWLHAPWPVDGQRLLQLTPHAPQFNGSVWRFTHLLLQAVWSGEVQVMQVEFVQIWLVPQACPQPPQLRGSTVVSTHTP